MERPAILRSFCLQTMLVIAVSKSASMLIPALTGLHPIFAQLCLVLDLACRSICFCFASATLILRTWFAFLLSCEDVDCISNHDCEANMSLVQVMVIKIIIKATGRS